MWVFTASFLREGPHATQWKVETGPSCREGNDKQDEGSRKDNRQKPNTKRSYTITVTVPNITCLKYYYFI